MSAKVSRPDLGGPFLDEQVYPALFGALDSAFPEFGWERKGEKWEATAWPSGFPCPAEGPRPERLQVYADRPWWIKVHGHAGVRWLDLVNGGRKPRGEEFVAAVRELARRAGVAFPEDRATPEQLARAVALDARREALEASAERCRAWLHDTPGAGALSYLRQRGLSTDEILDLGLGYLHDADALRAHLIAGGVSSATLSESRAAWPRLQGYVVIPWLDAAGRCLTLYGRWPAKTAPEGLPKTIALPGADTKGVPLFFDRARRAGHEQVVLVEGLLDVALLQARGDTRVVAAVAAQLSGHQLESLARHRVRSVIVCGDPDAGGDRGNESNVRALARAGIASFVAPVLPHGLDPDELVLRDGLPAWKAHLDRAVSGAAFLLERTLGEIKPADPAPERRRVLDLAAQDLGHLAASDPDLDALVHTAAERTGHPKRAVAAQVKRDRERLARDKARARVEPDAAFRLTDLGNARRLTHLHGHRLRFCAALGWLVWDGRRWTRDEEGAAERFAHEVPDAIREEARVELDGDRRKALEEHAEQTESRRALEAMVSLAQSLPGVPVAPDALDRDPWLLNVANGTVDLRNGTLRAHDPADLLTRLCPVVYDPLARSELWERFLDVVTVGRLDLGVYLQRVAGYCLTGDVREQCFFLLHGKGSNGKSTFLGVLNAVLGDHAAVAQFSTFCERKHEGIRSDIASLRGARLVSAIEAKRGARLDEGLVKQITGGDPVTARFLHKNEFTFAPTLKLLLAANEKPRVSGTDDGAWRRVRLVPFAAKIPPEQKDKTLKERLVAEASGVLAWAVGGCLAWQREGLAEPEDVLRATEEYRREEDVVGTFLDERAIFRAEVSVGSTSLYAAYRNWCEDRGIDKPWSHKAFSASIAERDGVVKDRDPDRNMRWRGVGLLVDAEPMPARRAQARYMREDMGDAGSHE